MARETTIAREGRAKPVNALLTNGISSRTMAYGDWREARRNNMTMAEQAIRARAFDLQQRYGNISGNQPFVPQNEQRNNTRIRRAVERMIG